jgi:2-keto-4-pentenoate hydratase/2-oxohepta-3-ene-1,7-dioic acid hydratase in catechol pathway
VRIARFSGPDGSVSFGVVDGVGPGGEDDGSGTLTPVLGHPFGALELAGPPVPLAGVRLLAPVLPSKIVAVGKNYAAHAQEMGGEVPLEPMIFLKPSTAVIGPGDPITLPEQSERVEHEAELAVVIGRLCSEVPIRRVPEVVLGYTCANDVTARDLQATDGQWGRAKGFDTFCPLGPWIETELDPTAVGVRCTVNGEVRQDGTTADLVRGVAELVAWISNVMTLLPGDVILTGTPAGVGPLVDGDSVSVSLSSIGTLTNRVVTRA